MGKHIFSECDLLLEQIEAYIETNGLKPGDLLPSERDFAILLNTSRATLRKALQRMMDFGYIHKDSGRGSVISKPKFTEDATHYLSYSVDWISQGYSVRNTVLCHEVIHASEKVAGKLLITVNEPVFHLQRVRFTNETPLMIEHSYIPYKYCKGIEKFDFSDLSLFKTLEDTYCIRLVRQKEIYSITFLNSFEAGIFDLPSDSPAFFIQGQTLDIQNRIIEYSEAVSPADRYKIIAYMNMKKPNGDTNE